MNVTRNDGRGEDDIEVLERLLRERHSCRAFAPRPVPRAVIERLLALAQRTASWCNTQPWQVVVTSGAATDAFRAAYLAHVASCAPAPDIAFPREYQGVYQQRRRECGLQLYATLDIARDDRDASRRQALRNYALFDAPHVAIVTTDAALGPYGAVDCGAFVANFLLAAQALGLGAIAQAALASHSGFVRTHFGLPPQRQVVCGISFGHADAAAPVNRFRTTRAGLPEAVAWVEDQGECKASS